MDLLSLVLKIDREVLPKSLISDIILDIQASLMQAEPEEI